MSSIGHFAMVKPGPLHLEGQGHARGGCTIGSPSAPHIKQNQMTHLNRCCSVCFYPSRWEQVTTDPVGLYLYLLKAFSDERHELLEDDRRFTDFVAR